MGKHMLSARHVTSFAKTIFNNHFQKIFENIEQRIICLKLLTKTLKPQLYVSLWLALCQWLFTVRKNVLYMIYKTEHAMV